MRHLGGPRDRLVCSQAAGEGGLIPLGKPIHRPSTPEALLRHPKTDGRLHSWILQVRQARHLHFTPTSGSWLNMVERWFGELTTKKIKRGAHTSVKALEKDIRDWIKTWN